MRSILGALAAVLVLSAAVDAEKILCPDRITDLKVLDNGPLIEICHGETETLKGGFYFNKTGAVYRMKFDEMSVIHERNMRNLNLTDQNCGNLVLRYRENRQQETFVAISARLLVKKDGGHIEHDCSVNNPELYFKAGEQHGKQLIHCWTEDADMVTTLIIDKFRVDFGPTSGV